MKQTKYNLIILIVISIYLIFVKITNIRICLIYNLFHIPCPACGLTRAYIALFNGDLELSLSYNILAIPIAIFFSLFFILSLIDDIKKTNKLEDFFKRNRNFIVPIFIFLVFISWSINLLNKDLY